MSFSQKFTNGMLRLLGWEAVIMEPVPEKCIIIGAPHTTNLDLPFTLMLIYATKVRSNWLAKKEVFNPPFGKIFSRLGGIPVDRSRRHNLVKDIATRIRESDVMRIAIAPEGTRSLSKYWKTGFYYMALEAKVPIVMGYIDYAKKKVGFGPSFMPSGDIQADFEILRNFYTNKIGLHRKKTSEIVPKPRRERDTFK
jgi:1-acyl-sn-glycerol-3-phosphate acyltransferase